MTNYELHSMMHVAEANISGLEESDVCKQSVTGYKFTPESTNCRVQISGGSEEQENPWKLMIYGGTSTQEAKSHINELKQDIEKGGGEFELIRPPEITNLVVGGSLDHSVNLESISVRLNKEDSDVEYEPEQFPALILHLDEPSCTVLLFSTGELLIQGVSELEPVPEIIERVKKRVKES